MKKIFLSLLTSLIFASYTFANEIKQHVKNTSFGVGSKVGLYIINFDNGKEIYKKNEYKSLNPASLLKLLSFGVSYDVLGPQYAFETALYQDNEKNIYVKLGGDVLLTQTDLNYLISNLKNVEYKDIYIDDSIFDKVQYPSSWLKEDIWPNQRAITPYVIDNNFVNVAINRSSLARKVDIIQNDEYKISFINELKIDDKQDIKIVQLYGKDSLIVNLQGSVAEDANLKIPVLRPDINFNVKLNKALDKNNILHSKIIASKKAPLNSKKIAFVSHSIEEVSKLILHNSDNFASEVVFVWLCCFCFKQ